MIHMPLRLRRFLSAKDSGLDVLYVLYKAKEYKQALMLNYHKVIDRLQIIY